MDMGLLQRVTYCCLFSRDPRCYQTCCLRSRTSSRVVNLVNQTVNVFVHIGILSCPAMDDPASPAASILTLMRCTDTALLPWPICAEMQGFHDAPDGTAQGASGAKGIDPAALNAGPKT